MAFSTLQMSNAHRFACPRWYALYTRSRYEKKVDLDLRSRGIESYLPLVQEVHCWSDRKKKVWEPLFRGYVFVRTDLREKVSILQTPGVVRFVGIRHVPSSIPDEQINWIRILTNAPDALRRETYLAVGETVRITAGPFRGVEGFIVRVKDCTRVVISLAAIAQSVSVEVPAEFVEPVITSLGSAAIV
jgi:transcription antitermination factor NusG